MTGTQGSFLSGLLPDSNLAPNAAAQAHTLPAKVNSATTPNTGSTHKTQAAVAHTSGQASAPALAPTLAPALAPASAPTPAPAPASPHASTAAPGPPSTPSRPHEEGAMSPDTIAMVKKLVAKGQIGNRSRLTPIFQTLLDSVMVDPTLGLGDPSPSPTKKKSGIRPKMRIAQPDPKPDSGATLDLLSDGDLSDAPSASSSNPPLDPEFNTNIMGTTTDRTRAKKASGGGRQGKAGGSGGDKSTGGDRSVGGGATGNAKAKTGTRTKSKEVIEEHGGSVSDPIILALR
jgi:hypothetical protein